MSDVRKFAPLIGVGFGPDLGHHTILDLVASLQNALLVRGLGCSSVVVRPATKGYRTTHIGLSAANHTG